MSITPFETTSSPGREGTTNMNTMYPRMLDLLVFETVSESHCGLLIHQSKMNHHRTTVTPRHQRLSTCPRRHIRLYQPM
jgi:hypothetical protein